MMTQPTARECARAKGQALTAGSAHHPYPHPLSCLRMTTDTFDPALLESEVFRLNPYPLLKRLAGGACGNVPLLVWREGLAGGC